MTRREEQVARARERLSAWKRVYVWDDPELGVRLFEPEEDDLLRAKVVLKTLEGLACTCGEWTKSDDAFGVRSCRHLVWVLGSASEETRTGEARAVLTMEWLRVHAPPPNSFVDAVIRTTAVPKRRGRR